MLFGPSHSSHALGSQLHDVALKLVLELFRLELALLTAEVKLVVDADDVDGKLDARRLTIRKVGLLRLLS